MSPQRKRVGRIVVVLGGLAVVAVAWSWLARNPAAAEEHQAAPSAVDVHAATATLKNIPVYLTGLGTVQAYYTAKITARVDGELQSEDFTEGQMVKKGQLLAQIDPRPAQAALDAAQATRAKDMAQLANAQDSLKRYEQLAPANLASKETVDAQRALVRQLQAQIEGDQAAIDNARTQLAYTRVTSPINGRTGIRLVDPGNIVHASDPNGIVVVTQIQPISVVFTLPEEDLLEVRRALEAGPVSVTASTRDGNSEQLDRGTVELVDNQIDQATGTMRVKATFPNRNSQLWPGQFVSVRMHVRTDRDAVTIPSIAVQPGPNGQFAYVIKPDSTVEVRPVKIAQDENGVSVVTSGLRAGERVVTSNQLRLAPGLRVHVLADQPAASAEDATATAPAGGSSS